MIIQKIIEKVLKLNNWNEEIEARLEKDIEKQIINGEVELLEADLEDKDNDNKSEDEQDGAMVNQRRRKERLETWR